MNKTIKNIIIWTLLIGYLIGGLSFTASRRHKQICTGIELIIKDTTQNIFIDRAEAITLIESKKGKFLGYPLDSINVAQVEQTFNTHPAVKEAEAYKTANGLLKIELKQRNPIMRIYSSEGDDFYIDIEGAIMPLSDRYITRVLVVSGNIPSIEVSPTSKKMIQDLPNDKQILKDIYRIGKFIWDNNFWKAQIEQVYINENNEFELSTKVGMQQIILGKIDKFEEKFNKLKTLYTEGFNYIGWTKYNKINLKFDGQVVCTKR